MSGIHIRRYSQSVFCSFILTTHRQNSTTRRIKLLLTYNISNLCQELINQETIKFMKTTLLIFMIFVLTITVR